MIGVNKDQIPPRGKDGRNFSDAKATNTNSWDGYIAENWISILHDYMKIAGVVITLRIWC